MNTEEENEQTPENAAYQGTAGMDIIVGSEEDDSVSSNAGVDVVMGEGGDDYIARRRQQRLPVRRER